jgi:hypothetical protein
VLAAVRVTRDFLFLAGCVVVLFRLAVGSYELRLLSNY